MSNEEGYAIQIERQALWGLQKWKANVVHRHWFTPPVFHLDGPGSGTRADPTLIVTDCAYAFSCSRAGAERKARRKVRRMERRDSWRSQSAEVRP